MKYRAMLKRKHPVGERQHEIEVVLDDHDRGLPAQPVEYREQFLHDRGCKAFEGFIQQKLIRFKFARP